MKYFGNTIYYDKNNLCIFNLEFIIWASDLLLNRLLNSKNIYIDTTFHRPIGFTQLMIIMFIDIILYKQIPLYIY